MARAVGRHGGGQKEATRRLRAGARAAPGAVWDVGLSVHAQQRPVRVQHSHRVEECVVGALEEGHCGDRAGEVQSRWQRAAAAGGVARGPCVTVESAGKRLRGGLAAGAWGAGRRGIGERTGQHHSQILGKGREASYERVALRGRRPREEVFLLHLAPIQPFKQLLQRQRIRALLSGTARVQQLQRQR